MRKMFKGQTITGNGRLLEGRKTHGERTKKAEERKGMPEERTTRTRPQKVSSDLTVQLVHPTFASASAITSVQSWGPAFNGKRDVR